MSNLPAIKEIYGDIVIAHKNDELVALMNQPPKSEWVKQHPTIRNYSYLPIERVEFLLKTIFKRYRIEITGQGQSFNGVWVTVRVHYVHPITGEWDYHDGIGAAELQLRAKTTEEKELEAETGKKFRVPFSTENINAGAISMAYPIAKTVAIKDACDHFGKLFGSDLNRKDTINYEVDLTLQPLDENHANWYKVVAVLKAKDYTVADITEKYIVSDEILTKLKGYYDGTIQD